MTTPHFEFFDTKLDYPILFPFCFIGSFCHDCDGNHTQTSFESQCRLGSVVYLESMNTPMGVWYFTISFLDSLCTTADYKINR